jgi:hypothetical protein
MKMNKFCLSILFFTLSLGLFGLSAQTASAQTSPRAEVLGFVKDCSTNVPFVPVTATCGTQTLSSITGSSTGDFGKYSITFNNESCGRGSVVNVSSGGASNSGTIGSYFWFADIANVDLQTGTSCETASVPEYDSIIQVMTIAIAGGVFFYIRQRQVV